MSIYIKFKIRIVLLNNNRFNFLQMWLEHTTIMMNILNVRIKPVFGQFKDTKDISLFILFNNIG